ncbi:ABC transporter ATP-binding protein [candidate division WWE3 bacterium]|nr:ABC transporter ATP-binding protein [candidate division WWE3 bacterium]
MIDLQQITKTYQSGENETQALKGVTIHVDEGEFVAIMGPSGSGKSTLMHILGALDKPSTGHYLLDGKDVSTYSEKELAELRKKKLGFVFQSFNLLPRTTAVRNVMLPLLYTNVSESKRTGLAEESLRAVGISEKHWAHMSNQLSGGQIQRVAIARALINSPRLILADEPTGNLDTKTSEMVLSVFQRLNNEGRTIVLITHEPDIANHAKRIISMRDGLIESDTQVKNRRISIEEKQ